MGAGRFGRSSLNSWIGISATKIPGLTKVEHIGIAVKDFASSIPLFERLLNVPCYKTETVESEKVNTAFFQTGETKIELLESTSSEGIIAKFIEKNGEGVHHLAFEVSDIFAEMQRLRNSGFLLLNEEPKKGADNKLVCFLHPRHTSGVLIELCMQRPPSKEDPI
jgi:methylmalonyl-CoA/ethylmalonyl-CoA epimerase